MFVLNQGSALTPDVFYHIMSFQLPQHRLPLMRTCHTLYELGLPLQIGGRVPYSISPQKLSSLCDLLLAHPSLLRAFKCLSLSHSAAEDLHNPSNSDRERSGKLVKILGQASHLQELELADAECILSWDESLSLAFSSLPNLNRLLLKNVGPLTYKFLKEMKAPISYISVAFGGRREGSSVTIDLVDLFQRFERTLIELDATLVHFQRKDIQFHNVHTVTLRNSYKFDIGILRHCFPNLRTLRLPGIFFRDELLETLRHQNRAVSQGALGSLDLLESDIFNAYVLGLRVQRCVRTWCEPHVRSGPRENKIFHELLKDLRPTRLSMRITYKDSGTDALEGLIPASPITHLRFFMTFPRSIIHERDAIRACITWVSKLKLQLLEMHIKYSDPDRPIFCLVGPERRTCRRRKDPEDALAGEQYFLQWDTKAYVQQLALVSPDLRHVFVYFYGILRSPSLWEIKREGIDIQACPVTEREASKVIDDEGFRVEPRRDM